MSHNEPELDRLEAALRAVRPAPPPAAFVARLRQAAPAPAPAAPPAPSSQPVLRWGTGVSPWVWLGRLLIPATAVVVAGVMAWRWHPAHLPAETGTLRADNVQINQDLVSTFDTVEPLPNGEPVRYRCREWMDTVVVRDSRKGLEVARRVPRIEVIPVRFEAY